MLASPPGGAASAGTAPPSASIASTSMTSRSIGMGSLLLARSLCGGGGGGGGPMGPKDAMGGGWRKAGGRPPTSAAVRLLATEHFVCAEIVGQHATPLLQALLSVSSWSRWHQHQCKAAARLHNASVVARGRVQQQCSTPDTEDA